jgi:hypothetical protein
MRDSLTSKDLLRKYTQGALWLLWIALRASAMLKLVDSDLNLPDVLQIFDFCLGKTPRLAIRYFY